jgi:hypothetical protein
MDSHESSSAHARSKQQAFSNIKREIAILIDELTKVMVKQHKMDYKKSLVIESDPPLSFWNTLFGIFQKVKHNVEATRLSADLDILLKLFSTDDYDDLISKNANILRSSMEKSILHRRTTLLLHKIENIDQLIRSDRTAENHSLIC